MEIRKIVKFVKHGSDSYSVFYDGFGQQRVCLSKHAFDLAQCIDEYIRRGIAPEDIKRIAELAEQVGREDAREMADGYPSYRDLVERHIQNEQARDGECS